MTEEVYKKYIFKTLVLNGDRTRANDLVQRRLAEKRRIGSGTDRSRLEGRHLIFRLELRVLLSVSGTTSYSYHRERTNL